MNYLAHMRGATSQADIIKRLGIPYITVPLWSAFENDKARPNPDDQKAIAALFGVSVRAIWPNTRRRGKAHRAIYKPLKRDTDNLYKE